MKTIVSAANSTVASSAVTITTAAGPSVSAPSGVTIIPKSESDTPALQFQTPSSVATAGGGNSNKRPISLDLNKPKKQRSMGGPSPLILESSDLNHKTLNTPDLEKILLSSNLLQTPQPGLVFPTKVGPVSTVYHITVCLQIFNSNT